MISDAVKFNVRICDRVASQSSFTDTFQPLRFTIDSLNNHTINLKDF
jgi:hypothetical protein